MAYRNLADFLEDLGRAGELASIDAEVDPCLEVAEVTRRIARQNGPALLFRNVKGHDIPLVTNLFGTEARILRALGADSIEEATARIDRALNGGGPDGWLERLRFGGKSGAAASFAANKVKAGACQQVVKIGSDINLLELPLMTWGWQANKAAICSALMLSNEPESGSQILLRGDLQIESRDTAVALWSEVADPYRLANVHRNRGGRMPLAIIIGGDPSAQLAANPPLPSDVDPLGLSGLLRDKPLESVPCRTIDLFVPAESDFVIEGWIEPDEVTMIVGPYSHNQPRHLLHVTAITHRTNAVFLAANNLLDDCERSVRNRLLARLFLPYLKARVPELVDFELPLAGSSRQMAILAIEKSYASQARHVATVAWGMRPFQFARLIIVVDAEVDVKDTEQIIGSIFRCAAFKENFVTFDGASDTLGHPTCQRLLVDATRGGPCVRDRSTENLVTARWSEYGLGPEDES